MLLSLNSIEIHVIFFSLRFQLMIDDVSIVTDFIFFSKQPLIWWIVDHVVFVKFDRISIEGNFSHINGVAILWNSQIMGANDSL